MKTQSGTRWVKIRKPDGSTYRTTVSMTATPEQLQELFAKKFGEGTRVLDGNPGIVGKTHSLAKKPWMQGRGEPQ